MVDSTEDLFDLHTCFVTEGGSSSLDWDYYQRYANFAFQHQHPLMHILLQMIEESDPKLPQTGRKPYPGEIFQYKGRMLRNPKQLSIYQNMFGSCEPPSVKKYPKRD